MYLNIVIATFSETEYIKCSTLPYFICHIHLSFLPTFLVIVKSTQMYLNQNANFISLITRFASNMYEQNTYFNVKFSKQTLETSNLPTKQHFFSLTEADSDSKKKCSLNLLIYVDSIVLKTNTCMCLQQH